MNKRIVDKVIVFLTILTIFITIEFCLFKFIEFFQAPPWKPHLTTTYQEVFKVLILLQVIPIGIIIVGVIIGAVLAVLMIRIDEAFKNVFENPTPPAPTSPTAKKSAPAVGKCQDCGCELLDTDATFCEDCQLAVFMANDEAVSLDQLGVAE